MTNVSLISKYDALLCDLDGVVYAGAGAIDGATEALDRLASVGVALGYITNNASRSSEQVAAHLRELGAPATPEQVFGSARAGAELLALHAEPGAKVLVTGSATLAREVQERGFVVVGSSKDKPAAVIQGFDPIIGWVDLAEASYAVAAGAVWVATNTDLTIPRAEGIAPGNGSLVAAVSAATGRQPLVAGKPEAPMFEAAARQLGASRPLVVGDRLDTDILGGNNAGMDTAVVLTGVDTVASILAARSAERPRYLLPDLAALYREYPEPVRTGQVFRCGEAEAEVRGGIVHLAGGGGLDGWRAACAAWWAAVPDTDKPAVPQIEQRARLD